MFTEPNNQNSYYIDYHFLETSPKINSFNWINYFQNHPDFDNSCLNLKFLHEPKISVKYFLEKKENGIFYTFEILENCSISQISKFLIDDKKCYLLKIYYLFENKIFDSANLKSTLLQKSANIGVLLNKAVELAFEED